MNSTVKRIKLINEAKEDAFDNSSVVIGDIKDTPDYKLTTKGSVLINNCENSKIVLCINGNIQINMIKNCELTIVSGDDIYIIHIVSNSNVIIKCNSLRLCGHIKENSHVKYNSHHPTYWEKGSSKDETSSIERTDIIFDYIMPKYFTVDVTISIDNSIKLENMVPKYDFTKVVNDIIHGLSLDDLQSRCIDIADYRMNINSVTIEIPYYTTRFWKTRYIKEADIIPLAKQLDYSSALLYQQFNKIIKELPKNKYIFDMPLDIPKKISNKIKLVSQ